MPCPSRGRRQRYIRVYAVSHAGFLPFPAAAKLPEAHFTAEDELSCGIDATTGRGSLHTVLLIEDRHPPYSAERGAEYGCAECRSA